MRATNLTQALDFCLLPGSFEQASTTLAWSGFGVAAVVALFLAWRLRRLIRRCRMAEKSLGNKAQEIQALNEDVELARKQATEAARSKNEFVSNISHEIRTPMNGIIGMTDLLLQTLLTGEQRSFGETIRASADSMLSVINDLLDFSKMQADRLEFDVVEFDLEAAVESVVDLLADKANRQRIELASYVAPDVPKMIRSDPDRLRQVLINLVGNAVKFTERGEVVLRVTTKLRGPDHAVLNFEVRDTGPGISPSAQPQLFSAFVQGDGSSRRRYGGTGLGLSISRRLVEMMGGQIGFNTTVGSGSTFWFTSRVGISGKRSGCAPKVADKLAGLRVLIVDDNAANRGVVQQQVSSWGMENDCADSGPEATALLRQAADSGKRYDVAILDHLAFTAGMQTCPAIAGVKIVILTSQARKLNCSQACPAAVAACLSKPVKQSVLFDCLAKVVSEDVSTASGSQRFSDHVCADSKQFRILLAEDNVVNQKVTLAQLRRLGYYADAVPDGAEVLLALDTSSYDIILMDCQMPRLDGYAATREIRKLDGSQRDITIIALTANAMAGERDRCLAAGMDDYISKPVRLEELGAMLDKWTDPVPILAA